MNSPPSLPIPASFFPHATPSLQPLLPAYHSSLLGHLMRNLTRAGSEGKSFRFNQYSMKVLECAFFLMKSSPMWILVNVLRIKLINLGEKKMTSNQFWEILEIYNIKMRKYWLLSSVDYKMRVSCAMLLWYTSNKEVMFVVWFVSRITEELLAQFL